MTKKAPFAYRCSSAVICAGLVVCLAGCDTARNGSSGVDTSALRTLPVPPAAVDQGVDGEEVAERSTAAATVAGGEVPPAEETQALDLRLPDDLLQPDASDTDDPMDRKRILPDLFQTSPNQQRTSVSGSLLLDEEEAELQDSINGVQLRVEKKNRLSASMHTLKIPALGQLALATFFEDDQKSDVYRGVCATLFLLP